MAIYRLSVSPFSRGAGSNVVAAAAYRSGAKLEDRTRGITLSYEGKSVTRTEIFGPEWMPEALKDRETLWNTVEEVETRKNSRLARDIQVALPCELSAEAQWELVRTFVESELVPLGMIADVAMHPADNDERNVHAHILITDRPITPEGFANRKDALWKDISLLRYWRRTWELYVNRALAEEGSRERVHHRSYEARGIGIVPQPKLFRALGEMQTEGRQRNRDRVELFREAARRNGDRIIEEPGVALALLTENEATFSDRDLARLLNRMTDDEEQYQVAMRQVLGSRELVELTVDDQGRRIFTTFRMLDQEKKLLGAAEKMAAFEFGGVRGAVAADILASFGAQRGSLSGEQEAAYRHIVEGRGGIAVVEGIAGSGKSHMLAAARLAWEAEGHRVIGAALAGKAAEGLEDGSGIASRTVASWEFEWACGRGKLERGDVLVVDEAGMIGTVMMAKLLGRAETAGAKVVLVGDSQQLQAIAAGSPLRALSEKLGCARLTKVRRQQVDWQAAASEAFFDKRAQQGLAAYLERDRVVGHESLEAAQRSLVRRWAEVRAASPETSQLIMAYRRTDVRALNKLCRETQRDAGRLGRGRTYEVEIGGDKVKREFALGDRLYFLKNSDALGVANGTLGTVLKAGRSSLDVELDSGRVLTVELDKYRALDHGYAATVHKAQGVTVDRAYLLGSDLLDEHSTYVALTRHREDAEIHYSRKDFDSEAKLVRSLSRQQDKGLASEVADVGEADEAASSKLDVAERFLALAAEKQNSYLAELDRLAKQPVLTVEAAVEGLAPVAQARENADDASRREEKALRVRRELGERLSKTERKRSPEWREAVKEADAAFKAARESEKALREVRQRPDLVEKAHHQSKAQGRETMAAHRQGEFLRGEVARKGRELALAPWLSERKKEGHPVRLLQKTDIGAEARYVGKQQIGDVLVGVFVTSNNDRLVMDLTGRPAVLAGITRGHRVQIRGVSDFSPVETDRSRTRKKERDR